MHNTFAAARALLQGQPGFFKPRFPLPFWSPFTGDAATSFYDTSPLHQTLERLVDFDRLNSGDIRVSVGAVNVSTGNLTYFDTAERPLGPKHFMASGALPPGFPAIEIDGEHYWDGGVVWNTPLSHVLASEPRRETLTFQIAQGHPVFEPNTCHHRSGEANAKNAQGFAANDREIAGEREG
jgi:NTE family protein